MVQFDVFLSHNSIDKPWVIQLKNDLHRYGVSVWLDKDEIRPGDLFARALEEGLESCNAVALIVSPEAMASGWVEEEYYRALSLTKDKATPAQLIPVILRDAEVPGFAKSRNWVDFRDESSYAENVAKLVWGVTGQKPTEVLDLTGPPSPPPVPRPTPAPVAPEILPKSSNTFNQQDQTVHGSKTDIAGNVKMEGGFFQPNWKVEGDVIQAQRDVIMAGRDVNQGSEALTAIFADLMKQATSLPVADQDIVKSILIQAEDQAEKIQQGDVSPEAQDFLEQRLKNLVALAPDIGEVAIATLISPPLGVSLVIKKIAEKVQKELKGNSKE